VTADFSRIEKLTARQRFQGSPRARREKRCSCLFLGVEKGKEKNFSGKTVSEARNAWTSESDDDLQRKVTARRLPCWEGEDILVRPRGEATIFPLRWQGGDRNFGKELRITTRGGKERFNGRKRRTATQRHAETGKRKNNEEEKGREKSRHCVALAEAKAWSSDRKGKFLVLSRSHSPVGGKDFAGKRKTRSFFFFFLRKKKRQGGIEKAYPGNGGKS